MQQYILQCILHINTYLQCIINRDKSATLPRPPDQHHIHLVIPRKGLQLVWQVRSPGTVSHCTFVRHLHYQRSKTCSRHIFSHVPTLLTVSRARAANIVRRPCSDSSHVTAPYKLSFYYYYFYYCCADLLYINGRYLITSPENRPCLYIQLHWCGTDITRWAHYVQLVATIRENIR